MELLKKHYSQTPASLLANILLDLTLQKIPGITQLVIDKSSRSTKLSLNDKGIISLEQKVGNFLIQYDDVPEEKIPGTASFTYNLTDEGFRFVSLSLDCPLVSNLVTTGNVEELKEFVTFKLPDISHITQQPKKSFLNNLLNSNTKSGESLANKLISLQEVKKDLKGSEKIRNRFDKFYFASKQEREEALTKWNNYNDSLVSKHVALTKPYEDTFKNFTEGTKNSKNDDDRNIGREFLCMFIEEQELNKDYFSSIICMENCTDKFRSLLRSVIGGKTKELLNSLTNSDSKTTDQEVVKLWKQLSCLNDATVCLDLQKEKKDFVDAVMDSWVNVIAPLKQQTEILKALFFRLSSFSAPILQENFNCSEICSANMTRMLSAFQYHYDNEIYRLCTSALDKKNLLGGVGYLTDIISARARKESVLLNFTSERLISIWKRLTNLLNSENNLKENKVYQNLSRNLFAHICDIHYIITNPDKIKARDIIEAMVNADKLLPDCDQKLPTYPLYQLFVCYKKNQTFLLEKKIIPENKKKLERFNGLLETAYNTISNAIQNSSYFLDKKKYYFPITKTDRLKELTNLVSDYEKVIHSIIQGKVKDLTQLNHAYINALIACYNVNKDNLENTVVTVKSVKKELQTSSEATVGVKLGKVEEICSDILLWNSQLEYKNTSMGGIKKLYLNLTLKKNLSWEELKINIDHLIKISDTPPLSPQYMDNIKNFEKVLEKREKNLLEIQKKESENEIDLLLENVKSLLTFGDSLCNKYSSMEEKVLQIMESITAIQVTLLYLKESEFGDGFLKTISGCKKNITELRQELTLLQSDALKGHKDLMELKNNAEKTYAIPFRTPPKVPDIIKSKDKKIEQEEEIIQHL